MIFSRDALARVGVVALFAGAALATVGAPGYAAGTETDLELSVVGTTVAEGADRKVGWAKITNRGTNTPAELSVLADLSALDFDKVFAAPAGDECSGRGDTGPTEWICEVPAELIPGPGETLDFPIVVLKLDPAAGGYRAPITYTISSPDDTTPGNNAQTADVVFSESSGVDLGVEVPDVKEALDPATGEVTGPLVAGGTTAVIGLIYNWGDAIAKGIKVTVRLPERVTFAETESDCVYTADNRTATCSYPSVVLVPLTDDLDGDFVAAIYWPITVDEGVEAPVSLTGGSWTVEAMGQVSPDARIATGPADLPENLTMVSANEAGVTEIDESDNVDGFSVVVSGGSDGGGGGDGGLPVTGVRAGLFGGIGLAVVVTGGALLLLSRRRRVVLVTPGDEKSAD
nr:cell wall anchor protein [Micromonospora sp. DSM 115978]